MRRRVTISWGPMAKKSVEFRFFTGLKRTGGTASTIVVAVNGAALIGATRAAAEARCRVSFGFSLLSAGTPMFFMAEEIGAQKLYKFNSFIANREDIIGERAGNGKQLFRFYQDLISL